MYEGKSSSNAVLVLVLGILGMVGCGCFTGIPAWIMGRNTIQEMDRGTVDPKDRGLAQAGMILGMVTTILGSLAICLYLMFIGFAFLSSSGPRP